MTLKKVEQRALYLYKNEWTKKGNNNLPVKCPLNQYGFHMDLE
jgi:hypothetical protein